MSESTSPHTDVGDPNDTLLEQPVAEPKTFRVQVTQFAHRTAQTMIQAMSQEEAEAKVAEGLPLVWSNWIWHNDDTFVGDLDQPLPKAPTGPLGVGVSSPAPGQEDTAPNADPFAPAPEEN